MENKHGGYLPAVGTCGPFIIITTTSIIIFIDNNCLLPRKLLNIADMTLSLQMCEFDLSTVSLVSLGPCFFPGKMVQVDKCIFLGLIFEDSPELPEPHPRTEVLNDVSVLLDALKLKGEKLEEAARPGRRLSVLLHEFWERSPIENPWLSNGKSTNEMEVLIGKCPIRSL